MKILLVDNSAIVCKDKLHFTNSLNGLFLSELLELGYELSYLQFAKQSIDNISVFGLEQNGVRCVPLSMTKNKVVRYLSSIPKLFMEIKKADFVYFYYPNTLRWSTVLCILLNKPYGLYIRGMIGISDRISRFIYKKAITVLTVSDFFTNMVNEIVGKKISNTIRPMIPYTEEDVFQNRKYPNKATFNILYLGRIAKDKGLTELLTASNQLADMGYAFELHLVGNGEYLNELKQMAVQLNMTDYVFFDGPVYDNEKKAGYYKEADLYVIPTYHEGFPRTLYEAMIFGTPIITTFVGGIPTLMKDGINCIRIEPRSVDSIRNALVYSIENYSEMSKLAVNATKMVQKIVDKRRPSHATQLNTIIRKNGISS